ncbi:MAG: hypothetical protein FWG68_03220 [Defluviitaleaceae bacterium]|nr:hypothetical protein [Defluviitaleaceae bacterium]
MSQTITRPQNLAAEDLTQISQTNQKTLTEAEEFEQAIAGMTEEEEMEYIVKMIKESRRERWQRDWQFNAEKNCWVYIGDSENAYKQQHMIIKPTDNGKFCTAFDKSAYETEL